MSVIFFISICGIIALFRVIVDIKMCQIMRNVFTKKYTYSRIYS